MDKMRALHLVQEKKDAFASFFDTCCAKFYFDKGVKNSRIYRTVRLR